MMPSNQEYKQSSNRKPPTLISDLPRAAHARQSQAQSRRREGDKEEEEEVEEEKFELRSSSLVRQKLDVVDAHQKKRRRRRRRRLKRPQPPPLTAACPNEQAASYIYSNRRNSNSVWQRNVYTSAAYLPLVLLLLLALICTTMTQHPQQVFRGSRSPPVSGGVASTSTNRVDYFLYHHIPYSRPSGRTRDLTSSESAMHQRSQQQQQQQQQQPKPKLKAQQAAPSDRRRPAGIQMQDIARASSRLPALPARDSTPRAELEFRSADGNGHWIPIVARPQTSDKHKVRQAQAQAATRSLQLSLDASPASSDAQNTRARLLDNDNHQESAAAPQRQRQHQQQTQRRRKPTAPPMSAHRNQSAAGGARQARGGGVGETQLAQGSHLHGQHEFRHSYPHNKPSGNNYHPPMHVSQNHHHHHHHHHHHWPPPPPPPPPLPPHRRPRFQQTGNELSGGTMLENEFGGPPMASKTYKRVLLCDKTLVSLDYIHHLELEPRPQHDNNLANYHLNELEINEINDNFLDLEGALESLPSSRSDTTSSAGSSSPSSSAVNSSLSSGEILGRVRRRLTLQPRAKRLEVMVSPVPALGNVTSPVTTTNSTSGDIAAGGGGGGAISSGESSQLVSASQVERLAANGTAASIVLSSEQPPSPSPIERRGHALAYRDSLLLNDRDPLVRCDMWDLEKGLKSRKPPEHILRMAIKADFDTVRDAINRCRQLSEKTLPPEDEYRDGPLELMSTEDLVSLFSMKRGLMPGTKWCGLGDQAEAYNDLGPKHRIDICCRAHDHCPIRSKPFRNDYGVLNIGLYTKSHCDCDADFYRCLREVRSRTADMLGNLYFNVMKLQCMREERLKVCREMKPIALGFERCVRYEPSPVKTVFKFTTPPVAY